MRKALLIFSLIPSLAFSSGQKAPPASISFHLESGEGAGAKMVREVETVVGKKWFSNSPFVSNGNVASFAPFPAKDGTSFGVVFQVDGLTAKRLEALTGTNINKLVMPVVNGQPTHVFRIDESIKDGQLVVWSGVTEREIKAYDFHFPRIGQSKDEWEKNVKKLKKELKEAEKQRKRLEKD